MRVRCLLSLLVFMPGVLAAQRTTLVVNVGEDGTGAFIQDALVRIPDLGRVARTNWQGEARMPNLPQGDYRVQVTKFGFAPSEVVMRIAGDTASAFFILQRMASRLDTVRVEAMAYTPHLQEFDTHRRMGIARIVGDSVLRANRIQALPILLAHQFPVFIMQDTLFGGLTVGRPNGGGSLSPCTFFLDGFKFYDSVDMLKPDDLFGVEYYTAGMTPVQYKFTGVGPCAILMWSRW